MAAVHVVVSKVLLVRYPCSHPPTKDTELRFTEGDISHFAPSTERSTSGSSSSSVSARGVGMVDDVFHGNLENTWPTSGMSVNDTKLRTSEETYESPLPK